MISKLPVTYPALPPRQADLAESGLAIPTRPGTRAPAGWVQEAAKIAATVLITAVLTLGFALLSLGVGSEGSGGGGVDRVPPLAVPAPAPPPELAPFVR